MWRLGIHKEHAVGCKVHIRVLYYHCPYYGEPKTALASRPLRAHAPVTKSDPHAPPIEIADNKFCSLISIQRKMALLCLRQLNVFAVLHCSH
jgi:hypothetical protein